MATIKKAQNGATTNSKETLSQKNARLRKEIEAREKRIETRQKEKEKNSYSNTRANRVVGKKMKNGGSLSGLTASTKRDNGTDPKGAFTKVQKKTLAGAKGKVSLTKDKQLGATKMAKRGMSIKKK
jgi:hypothetical protein